MSRRAPRHLRPLGRLAHGAALVALALPMPGAAGDARADAPRWCGQATPVAAPASASASAPALADRLPPPLLPSGPADAPCCAKACHLQTNRKRR